jgi:AcrR family transcriptional regulator
MTQNIDALASTPADEPTWKQRAVERSTRAAKLRAEQRVQRFLDAAQVIIAEKGSTDFTVQEVVDRSRQSLRSFYQHFDGKHELLLALFEDALSRATEQIRAAAQGRAARCLPISRRSCCCPTRRRCASPTRHCSRC